MFAQEGSVVAAGNATGASGSSSFTVGQLFTQNVSNANGTISEGIQLSYEVSTLSNPELESIKLNVSTYPNPTTDKLIIAVKDIDVTNMRFVVHDINGREVINQTFTNNHQEVKMKDFPTGIYILTTKLNNKPIKTFKIIKN